MAAHIEQTPVHTTGRKQTKITQKQKRAYDSLTYGRQSMGFDPITQRYIDKMVNENEEWSVMPYSQAEPLARAKAIRDFLRFEMKMSEENITSLKYDRVFFSLKKDTRILYAMVNTSGTGTRGRRASMLSSS